MRAGVYISAAAHLALIAFVIFGGPVFEATKETRLQVTDVTLVDAAVLDAVASRAPQPPRTQTDTPTPPRIVETQTLTPTVDSRPAAEPSPAQPAPSAETPPDLSDIAEAPAVAVVSSAELVELPSNAPDEPVGLGGVSPVAIEGQDVPVSPEALALAVPPKPSDAPRVDTTAAPKPPTDAVRAETDAPEVVADEMSVEPEDERPEEAPDEATTNISPDPVEVPPPSVAPLASVRPRGRPAGLARPARESPAESANVASTAEAPEQTTATSETASAAPALPVGPPLTGGEIDGLRLAIRDCWAVPAGLRNAEELEVVVGVTLSQEGKIVGNKVRWLEPSDQSDPRFRAAYRAARSAMIRCQPYEMPRGKYAQWKDLEVVFNPEGMKGLW